MNRIVILFFLLIFSIGFSQKREFKNQGEQENYWAEQIFEKDYRKETYPKFNSEIKQNNKTEILFGNKTLKISCLAKYLPIFMNGLFYPQLIIGNEDNNKILTEDEIGKMKSEEKFFYNMSKNDSFSISNLEELEFLKTSPEIKRFRFWSFRPGFANPQVYYFELTNETADKKTSFEDFIKGSNLTFIKSGHIVI